MPTSLLALSVLLAAEGGIWQVPTRIPTRPPTVPAQQGLLRVPSWAKSKKKSKSGLEQMVDLYYPPSDPKDLETCLVPGVGPQPLGLRKYRRDVDWSRDWIRAVHVWFVNDKGEVLMQRRTEDWEEFKGKWDVSVRGELSSADSSVEAAVKEVSDDIDLDLDQAAIESFFFSTVPQTPKRADGGTFPRAENVNKYFDLFVLPASSAILTLEAYKESDIVFVSLDELRAAWLNEDEEYVWRPRHYADELEAAVVRLGREMGFVPELGIPYFYDLPETKL